MAFNKNAVRKYILCSIGAALFFELYIILGIVYINRESIVQYKRGLIGVPIVFGPSLGFVFYSILNNIKLIKEDISLRGHIIIMATIKSLIIIAPLWLFVKLIGLF